ncbi:MAG: glycoside hydrolase family 13 protein [Thermoflexaceae bacterium]|nr:glycoside hydrolase family 13 protein [Thermoflexaceae bacterium]
MIISKDLGVLSDEQKKLFYMSNVKPVLNRRALFSDETENYRIPAEPDYNEEVTIRFRTYRYNVDKVVLVTNTESYLMKRAYSDIIFDYYEACFNVGTEKIDYYFEITSGKAVVYYNKIGVYKELNPYYNYTIIPGFKTPDWAKGAVMYQIFTDRFCNGDTSNDVLDNEYAYIGEGVEAVKDWYAYPKKMDVRSFYGGDLQGVLDKLDYLKNLGVDVIYFNPLFVSPSNHKYDTQDYDYIDPHFAVIVDDTGETLHGGDTDNAHATRYINRVTGKKNLEASNEFFAHVVEEIHKHGMKVILDGVFNHCGSFNKWLDKEGIYKASNEEYPAGAYWEKDSPYHGFFGFSGGQWPKNNQYEGWWGHDTLPKLNYEGSSKLEEYILRIAAKWVSPPYNCDGWRLDVAADLGHGHDYNHDFWKRFRKAVKRANPNAIILAEHYGDAHDWLCGNEWDTVMNYDGFMEPLTWFLTGLEKHSDEFNGEKLGNPRFFFDAMRHQMSRMGSQAVGISMNELSNHDHSRFLTRTNRQVGRLDTKGSEAASTGINKGTFREAVVVQMTWPGAPTIYYGDEAGVCGWTDPDNRRTYPWGREDKDLIDFHRDMIRIHKENPALMKGSIKELATDYNLISYGRFYGDNIIIVIVNNSEDERRVMIPVWELGSGENCTLEQLMVTTENDYSTMLLYYELTNGMLDIGLRGTSAVVLRKVNTD